MFLITCKSVLFYCCVGISNSVLSVTVANVNFPAEAQLQCTFLSGITGSARCWIRYGTDPTYTNLPYSAESNETGTAGEIVSVVLKERLNSSSVYYYTVSIVGRDVTVEVQGSFTTPQYSKQNANDTSPIPNSFLLPPNMRSIKNWVVMGYERGHTIAINVRLAYCHVKNLFIASQQAVP